MAKKILKINDPIHGFVIFPDFITLIVDCFEFQRLNRIRQLSGASYVFPGANHTRFEHSIGVAALAQRLITNLKEIHGNDLDDEDIQACTIAALCHDIGHGPFSHNFEGLLMQYLNKDHEDHTEWIIEKSEIGDMIDELGFERNYISKIATGRIIGQGDLKGSIISQVITSAVNVDTMDYLLRDNYHCGTEGRTIDINRLLLSLDTIEGGLLGVDVKALIALEGFLLARLSSFRTIYFHKTCRAVQIMLEQAMRVASKDIGLFKYKNIDDFTKWDDYVLWTELLNHPKAKFFIEKLQKREILKTCFESRIEKANQEDFPKENEIVDILSKESNIPISEIFVDYPNSPNVPYSHFDVTRSNEIITFSRNNSKKKEPVKLEDYSIFFNQFKGKLRLMRVYTWPKYRKSLTESCAKVLAKYSY